MWHTFQVFCKNFHYANIVYTDLFEYISAVTSNPRLQKDLKTK